jgi:tryptophan synthase alpha chain
MNRINDLFITKRRNILSVYFTAGYPDLNSACKIICELEQNGIDMIEIGIPFSDPMADGPVIQRSSTQALRNGMSLKLLFTQLANIRHYVKIPLLLMGYLNPIIQYGFERFCADCQQVGVDGMIIPDLPFSDYIAEYKPVAEQHDLKIIMLITPDTSEKRIRLIDDNTDGFIYMVSSAATTGAQRAFDEQKQQYFQRINKMALKNPRLIGFGISNKDTLRTAFDNAAGGIVGSKFIQCLTEEKNVASAVKKLLKEVRFYI